MHICLDEDGRAFPAAGIHGGAHVHAEADGIGGKAVAAAGMAGLVRNLGAASDGGDAVIDTVARNITEHRLIRRGIVLQFDHPGDQLIGQVAH